jgi:hypothetical protein
MWLDLSGASHFFSFNTFGRAISKLHENVNVFSPRPSSSWVAKLLRFPYDSDLAEILFTRVVPADHWKKCHLHLFEAMRHRALDRMTYLCAIDALRYLQDKTLAAEFIERCLDELLTIPKELSYFANLLDEHPARQVIENARKCGSEGVISDFVRL